MAITHRNLDGYGTPPIDWARVEQTMATNVPQAPGTGGPGRHTAWLTTINPDGTPHVRPVSAESDIGDVVTSWVHAIVGLGLRRVDGAWTIAHEHHSFPTS